LDMKGGRHHSGRHHQCDNQNCHVVLPAILAIVGAMCFGAVAPDIQILAIRPKPQLNLILIRGSCFAVSECTVRKAGVKYGNCVGQD
ncbi:MAG: hypothetical protein KDJ66_06675, partial [Nitratireductor sp.]|nr:hypothetical protein [Nitratireductor sp.]